MSRADIVAFEYAKENGTHGLDYNQIYDAVKHGYHQAMEDVIEWIDNHWREYVNVDADGVVCFGHWKNDLRKAMKDE